MSELPDRHAAVIGINAYGNGMAALSTAVADARAVATFLGRAHGYADPIELLDEEANLDGIVELLEIRLPALGLSEDSGLVLYFAGHGVAFDDDEGPRGYLIPQDARLGAKETYLPMDRVRAALGNLPCRHLLVVLDCCFAGSFRWAASRKIQVPDLGPLYDSQYARYLKGEAWQVLTSASHQELAQDVAPGSCNYRDQEATERHSPFATAFLEGLAGASDSSRGEHGPDGVITATELYQYIFEELVPVGERRVQTPGLWPLKPANTGEFIFQNPRREKKTRPDPPLDDGNNPWLGLATYSASDTSLFFGRERVVRALLGKLRDDSQPPLLAVVGASGTGKSSVVKAGVLPRLCDSTPAAAREETPGEWNVVVCERLGRLPWKQLADAVLHLEPAPVPADRRQLLVIDQFEELFTQRPDPDEQRRFSEELTELLATAGDRGLRVLITLRSDFGPQLMEMPLATWLDAPAGGASGRPATSARGHRRRPGWFRVPVFSSDELREIIEGPAIRKALYFDPPELVGDLVDEVMAMPGGLPLLSFALAEMYRQARLRRRDSGALDRALTRHDYQTVGGVAGALHRRASGLIKVAENRGSVASVRRVALRMVSLQGGRVARRRIHRRELIYAGRQEQETVTRIIGKLTEARLVVADGDYLEPAHDTLVQAWSQSTAWLADAAESIPLLRGVWREAEAWQQAGRSDGSLWNEDPRLPQVEAQRQELNQLEREFVAAADIKARQEAERKKGQIRRLRSYAVAATCFLVIAVAALVQALKQRDLARNKTLAAQARSHQHNRLDLALLLSLELARRDDSFESRRLLFDLLESSPRIERLLFTAAPANPGTPAEIAAEELRTVAWSTDGRWLAAASGSKVMVFEVATGQPLKPPLAGSEAGASSLAWSGDGRWLAAGGKDGVSLWEVPSFAARSPFGEADETEVYAVAWSPICSVAGEPGDGPILAVAQEDQSVRLWDVELGQVIGTPLAGTEDMLTSVAWSPDGLTVAAAGMDQEIRLWEALTGEAIGRPLRGHTEGVMSLAWSADGNTLASASLDGTVRLWTAAGEPQGRPLDMLVGPLASLAWDGDSSVLAVGGIDGRVVFWEVAHERRRTPPAGGQIAALRSLAFSPDGRTVASGNGRAIVLWNTGSGPRLGRRIELDATEMTSVAWNRARTILAGEGMDPGSRVRTLRLWDAATGKPVPGLPRALVTGPRKRAAALAFSDDGKTLIAVAGDRTVHRYQIATGKVVAKPLGGDDSGRYATLAISSDGSKQAEGSDDGQVRLWQGESGETLARPWAGHAGRVSVLSWSPDGGMLAAGGADGSVRLWDATGGSRAPFKESHEGAVTSLAWSDDGRFLASGGENLTIRLWDVDADRRLGQPLDAGRYAAGRDTTVSHLAWSRDGGTLASAGGGRIVLWDVALAAPFAGPFHGHSDVITGLLFSDDDTLLSISFDGTLMRWAVDPEEWRQRACWIANRDLTEEEWQDFLPYLSDRPVRPDFAQEMGALQGARTYQSCGPLGS